MQNSTGADQDWDLGDSPNSGSPAKAVNQTATSPASPAAPGKPRLNLPYGSDNAADYTMRPRNPVDEARLKCEVDSVVLPNNLKDSFALWRRILKMPTETHLLRLRKRLFKQRVGKHLFLQQQGLPVIHTGDAMCPKTVVADAPSNEADPATVDVPTAATPELQMKVVEESVVQPKPVTPAKPSRIFKRLLRSKN